MAAQISDYFQYLADLRQELVRLIDLQPEKIKAVKAHDLDALDVCMKQEQAISLNLRGMEQKREKLQSALGIAGVSLRQLPQHCPAEERGKAQQEVEETLRLREELRSAQTAARTIIEKDLRMVNEELERRGIAPEMDEHYQAGQNLPPQKMRTDFRA